MATCENVGLNYLPVLPRELENGAAGIFQRGLRAFPFCTAPSVPPRAAAGQVGAVQLTGDGSSSAAPHVGQSCCWGSARSLGVHWCCVLCSLHALQHSQLTALLAVSADRAQHSTAALMPWLAAPIPAVLIAFGLSAARYLLVLYFRQRCSYVCFL